MNQGTNQNQSNSPTQKDALYDSFLTELNLIDEAPSTFEEKCPSWITRPSSESAEGSFKHVETSDSVAVHRFTEDEIQEFVRKIYKPVIPKKVMGFDHDEKTLKMLLLNEETQDSFKLLGVVGMLGVGKTTLCRLILDGEQMKQRYFPRLLITMPESPAPMENVVEIMLEHLGVEEEDIRSISEVHKLPGLLYALHLQLQGKKFLIVLDDVKEEATSQKENVKEEGTTSQEKKHYYEYLKNCLTNGHGFPKGYGGAVILNGRNQNVIQEIVGERNVHRLELLSDPTDCWEIYQTLATGKPEEHLQTGISASKEVEEELKKKCGGLPLAARIMGELKHREKELKHQKGKAVEASTESGQDHSTQAVEASK